MILTLESPSLGFKKKTVDYSIGDIVKIIHPTHVLSSRSPEEFFGVKYYPKLETDPYCSSFPKDSELTNNAWKVVDVKLLLWYGIGILLVNRNGSYVVMQHCFDELNNLVSPIKVLRKCSPKKEVTELNLKLLK